MTDIKRKAHQLVTAAVYKGILKRPDICSLCSNKCMCEGHHDDYNKPLEVKWVCTRCHGRIHNKSGNVSNLQQIREAKGVTQQSLADKAGVSVQTINRIEKGKTKPLRLTARAIAQALGVKLKELGC